MNPTEIRVRQVIADELPVDLSIVTSSARFVEDLGADSLDIVELIMRFEEEFGIEITDEKAEKLVTVGKAVEYFRDKEPVIPKTEKVSVTITRRRGQPEFRKKLLDVYGSQCAMTGYDTEAALEAAHIRPYEGLQSNQVVNGLLLRADIHTLFDLHLITVDTKSMTILLKPTLRETSYKFLHGKLLRMPKSKENFPDKEAINEHHAKCELKWSTQSRG